MCTFVKITFVDFQFLCDAKDFNAVRQRLSEHGLEDVEAYLGYVPIMFSAVPKDGVKIVSDMMNMLNEHIDDMVRVYDNYKLPEELK